MRCAKLTAAGTIQITDAEIPVITKENEVLIEVKAVGICGTDIHIFKGERSDVSYPRVMGHELAGIVRQIGKEVQRVQKGDPVVLDPVFSCGVCKICRKGHGNVCSDVKCYGVQMDGGFQDYIVVEEEHIYPFSKKISFEQAALAEPFSIGANINARADVTEEDHVVVLGSGTIGLCVAQVAKKKGAKVLVSDIEDEKLHKAKEAGADVVVNSRTESLQEAVRKFSPDGADVVIDAVGVAQLTEQAIAVTAPLARVVVIGFDNHPAKIPLVDITKKELSIVGSRMNCHQFPTVMKWLEEGSLNPDMMISKVYPIEKIQEAFEETIKNGSKTVKTLITF